jgi:Cu/Ag efflux protein CusF
MRKTIFGWLFVLATILLSCALLAPNNGTTFAQEDKSITPNGVIGEVTAIDAATKTMSIKTDAGNTVGVSLNDQTSYMRVPPGETTLSKATRITLAEIAVGDRVFARGTVAADRQSIPARMLIVMTKADIAQKHERDRAEWQRRGVSGLITAIDPAAKEVTVTARGREGSAPIVIAAGQGANVQFRRYAPNSVKFSDAKPSSFEELKVGDQVRALGEKNADNTRIVPEEIVSGAFRTLSGTVSAVNPQAGEVKIKSFADNKEINVALNQDSLLRRLPPQLAEMMAMRGAGGGPNREGNPSPGGTGPRPTGPPPGSGPGGPGGAGGPGGPGGGNRPRGGGFDIQEMLERLPALSVADLKAGDVVLFSSTETSDRSRATAITMIAGLDALANMMRQGAAGGNRGAGGAGGTGPGGAPPGLDLGIGLP